MKRILQWIGDAIALFFPKRCAGCGMPLQEGARLLCTHCLVKMPKTGYHRMRDNPMEQRLWGRIPIERAAAYYFYQKKGRYAHLIHLLKYSNRPDIGRILGEAIARECGTSFFEGIDLLLPVPLHPRRRRQRGYNQSEEIAKGVAQFAPLPIVRSIRRKRNTTTQTRKNANERWENVEGIFEAPDWKEFEHKHLLIIDDVMTTGSTIVSCAEALRKAEGVRFSVLTLACSKG